MQKQITIKPLTKYWVVVDEAGKPFGYTISLEEKDAIGKFMEDESCEGWKSWQNIHYRCIKVNIEFEQVK